MTDYKRVDIVHDIQRINFSIFSSDEVKRMSVARIEVSALKGEGSVYDSRLGVIQNHSLCVTCGLDNHECPGHFGHIELFVPILHPLFFQEIVAFLNVFCDSCYSLLMTPEQVQLCNLTKFKGHERFEKIMLFIKKKIKKCPSCKEERTKFIIRKEKLREEKIWKFVGEKPTKENLVSVSAEDVDLIFSHIPQSVIQFLGYDNPYIHPCNFIIKNFPVLPLCARPYVETGRGTCDDDLTTEYVEILKLNNKLKKGETKKLSRDMLIGMIEFHIRVLMNNSKKKARQANVGRPIKCIRERLDGKSGIFRNNLSGKRTDFSARSVIGPDTSICADEIVIPKEFSTKLTFPERCYSLNKNHLQSLVDSGKVNYVIRNNDKKNIVAYNRLRAFLKDEFVFEKGDMVIRGKKWLDPLKVFDLTGKEFEFHVGDIVLRDKKKIKEIVSREQTRIYLQSGDLIIRNGIKIDPEILRLKHGTFEFQMNDQLIRNDEIVPLKFVKNTPVQIQIGDIVERHLSSGDYVLFGRQPTQL